MCNEKDISKDVRYYSKDRYGNAVPPEIYTTKKPGQDRGLEIVSEIGSIEKSVDIIHDTATRLRERLRVQGQELPRQPTRPRGSIRAIKNKVDEAHSVLCDILDRLEV